MPIGNVANSEVTTAGTDWHLIISTIILAIAVLTLFLTTRHGNVLSQQLELLRKHVFGEVYETPKIRELQFFLPAKKKHKALGFENQQEEKQEKYLGKNIIIKIDVLTELHIRFYWDAAQKLRFFTVGFLDNYEGHNYEELPEICEFNPAFKKLEVSGLPRERYQDWHGNWHVEYGYEKFVAKDDCFVLCFRVFGYVAGKFPLHVEISTQEAARNHLEILWVEIIE